MKVSAYMSMSLNGQIANGQGKTHWGAASYQNYIDKVNQMGNLIMGRTTYDVAVDRHNLSDFDAKVKKVVVTSTPAPDDSRVSFVGSPREAIEAMVAAGFDSILVGGGPSLVASMVADGTLDQLCLDIEPIILPQKLAVLPKEDLDKRLKLLSVERYDTDSLTVCYEVLK